MTQLRVLLRMGQHELARRTGLHQPTISLIERGLVSPSEEQRALIAEALGIPSSLLFPVQKENTR